jgi:hypothetical protein
MKVLIVVASQTGRTARMPSCDPSRITLLDSTARSVTQEGSRDDAEGPAQQDRS